MIKKISKTAIGLYFLSVTLVSVVAAPSTWSEPIFIFAEPGAWASYPSIAVDRIGQVHVVWGLPDVIGYSVRGVDGQWSAPEAVPGLSSPGSCCGSLRRLTITATPDGNIHVTGYIASGTQAGLIGHIIRDVSGWSEVILLGDHVGSMRLTSDGTLHTKIHLPGTAAECVISQYDGTWTASPLIPFCPDVYHLEADGTIHAYLPSSNGEIGYSVLQPGGNWSDPVPINEGSVDQDHSLMAVDDAGRAHFVWTAEVEYPCSITTCYRQELRHRSVLDGQWTEPYLIATDNDTTLAHSMSADRALHLMYSHKGKLLYTSLDGEWQAAKEIAQGDYGRSFQLLTNDTTRMRTIYPDACNGSGLYFNWQASTGTATTHCMRLSLDTQIADDHNVPPSAVIVGDDVYVAYVTPASEIAYTDFKAGNPPFPPRAIYLPLVVAK